jgi:hypothetical protein
MQFPPEGDLTKSQIQKIMLKAEMMWKDSALNQEYIPHSDAAIAVLSNQTARFQELQDPNKDNKVLVNFVNPCGIEVADCGDLCDIDGNELSTGGKEYELDLCKSTAGFKIDRYKFRTNTYTYEEFAAIGLLQHIKALDEWWSAQVLAKLKAFAGINLAVATGDISAYGMTFVNGSTQIAASDYNLDLVTSLAHQQIVNNMPSGYIIDSGYLWKPIENAKLAAGNGEGKGDAAKANALAGRVTFDMFNFKKAGITEEMFMVNPGAVAFKTRARNPATPQTIGGKVQMTVYKVKSRILPGVEYDVYYTLKCDTDPITKQMRISDVWNFRTEGGIFLNPEGCPVTVGATEYNPNGVTAYNRVAA